MADNKKTTKKPSGLKITRNNKKFTFEWSLGETYVDQELDYLVATRFTNSGSPDWPVKRVLIYNKKHKVTGETIEGYLWQQKSIKKTTKTTSITVGKDTVAVRFRVRGKGSYKDDDKKTHNKKWSDYSFQDYTIKSVKKPSVGRAVVNAYTTTFAWETPNDLTAKEAFDKNEWQTALLTNCDVPLSNGNSIKSGWSSVETSGATGSKTFSETGWDTVANSYTRWIKVHSIGWGSSPFTSDWVYSNRVYASPNAPSNVKAIRTSKGSTGYPVTVTWTNGATVSRPVDSISVLYGKAPPKVEVVSPVSPTDATKMRILYPSEAEPSWSEGVNPGNATGNRTASFIDPLPIPPDNCFFVKVTNTHDSNSTDSAKVLPETGGYGRLANPSVPTTHPEDTPGLYTVSVQDRGTTIANAAIAVYFRTSSAQNRARFVGLMPPGESSTPPFKIPDIPSGDTISFGVQAFVGDYRPTAAQGTSKPTDFTANMLMSSDVVWGPGVPLPPEVTADAKDESTVHVTWTQSWLDATEAELSWSDHEDAWDSTDEPQTYIVRSAKAGAWNIANLGVGTWHIRVRLMKTSGDTVSYSAYSSTKHVKLSASPEIPSLLLSSNVIPKDGSVTCYWAYVSGDGTAQKQAKIYEAFPEYVVVTTVQPTDNPYNLGYYELNSHNQYVRTLDLTPVSGKTYYRLSGEISYSAQAITSTASEQHVTLYAKEMKWKPGETHNLVVTVMSMSGEECKEYSAPVSVTIAEKLSVSILSSNLKCVDIPIEYNDQEEVIETKQVLALTEFPLNFSVSGMEVGNKLTCIIERSEPFSIMIPDGTEYNGFEGNIVLWKEFDTGLVSIYRDDFIYKLDDTASYRVSFIINDPYGQTAKTSTIPTELYLEVDTPTGSPAENDYYERSGSGTEQDPYVYTKSIDTEVDITKTYYTRIDTANSFEVRWEHQAVFASAIVETDHENNISMITPVQPEQGYAEGDVVDIYRMSADLPELVVSNANFGTKYVDPYPAYGIFGGYRIVYRTYNGDYKTINNEFAFTNYLASEDVAYKHDTFGIIIDFGKDQVILPYNVSFSSKWSKDFSLTKYLGGSVQGDWNQAVERTMSAKTTIVVEVNPENIQLIRKLADYPGICHVRTPDGSSFNANIDVSDDREEKWTTTVSKISLDITKCDAESEEGMTYEEWLNR